ncbi:hypothetical protein [Microbispora sp. NPDC049125]|uniref:hypothetical protein n=1 Tax=Microbispora sp. NPDC049125 TaxID=3154929 RepID=UPI003467D11A
MKTITVTACAAAVLLAALTACSGGPAKPDGITASIMCERFVKDRLKAPGNADFGGAADTEVTTVSGVKPWQYKVRSYVDSENSFGAKIRTTYVCDIKTNGDGDWNLVDLQFGEQ